MNIRSYKTSDYNTLCNWWESHKWPILPKEMLPSTGLVVEDICAGFLYKTDSTIAWLEFIISNPSSNKQVRAEALNLLISSLVNKAKDDGFKAIFTSAEHPSLIERYKTQGFIVSDTSMTNLVRLI